MSSYAEGFANGWTDAALETEGEAARLEHTHLLGVDADYTEGFLAGQNEYLRRHPSVEPVEYRDSLPIPADLDTTPAEPETIGMTHDLHRISKYHTPSVPADLDTAPAYLICEWFAGCDERAVLRVHHPAFRDGVPTCWKHVDWLCEIGIAR